ncbi:unnamed protein product [Somion occarium]|uniref:SH3 domain-containing protein n=1 Tax=Somion occarium TaxID=3059160 RepID=A0ABP1D295_9APHY
MASALLADSPPAVDHPPSASPFPSPGSPFLPPPTIGSHEFASKPSSSSQTMCNIDTKTSAKSPTLSTQSDATTMPLSPSLDGGATPTATIAANSLASALSPTTPRPQSSFQIQQQPPSTPEQSLTVLVDPRRVSLASSRPAPPSPALSRRASAALSRQSSTARSRRQSKASTLSQQPDHDKVASSSSAATITQDSTPSRRRSWIVKIRDFAFSPSDERHAGRGPDAPRPNRARQRWSTMSSSSESSSRHSDIDEDAEDEQRHSSWSPFRWNTLSNHFSWGSRSQNDDIGGPSHTDFERNFDASSPVDESTDQPYPEDDDQDELEDDYPNEDEPLVPGLYRALYAFDPEGTAEMALEEEQMVRVVGRGGGVGWAIVEKDGGGHALVPESYLELVQADDA